MKLTRKQVIAGAMANAIISVEEPTERDIGIAKIAAHHALALAGFSDENVPDSPRPVENSPLDAQKKPGFGPEQTR